VILALALMLAGFVLTLAEVFFPSLGAFGIAAACAIAGADWVAHDQVGTGFMWVLVGVQLVAIPALLKFAFWALPKTPFGRGMILEAPGPERQSGVPHAEHLLGRAGVALTELRPSGTAQFGDERLTVVSEAGLVDAGTPVVVTSVEGFRIVVAASSPSPVSSPALTPDGPGVGRA